MVRGGGAVADVQQAAERGPERGGELRAPVARDGLGDPEALDPAREEGRSAVCRRRRGQRHSLRPPRGTIYDSK